MEVKCISLRTRNGEFAFMVDTRVGWQDPHGGTFSQEWKATLDATLKDGGADHLQDGWDDLYDVRVHVEL